MLMEADAPTLEELLVRQRQNTSMRGDGIMNIHVSCPCPFCGTEGFMVFRLIDIKTEIKRKRTCGACLRSSQAWRDAVTGNYQFYWLAGPELPPYLDAMYPRLQKRSRW